MIKSLKAQMTDIKMLPVLLLLVFRPFTHAEESSPLTPTAVVINHVGRALTSQIGGRDNLFISPLSISLGLGMVYLGARGSTAQQMRSVLRYDVMEDGADTSEDTVHRHFRTLMTSLESDAGSQYTLLMANGMFPQVGFEVRSEFESKLQTFYSAISHPLDYAEDGPGSVNFLNQWVHNRTNGKIAELFSSPLDTTTLLVLLNTVYFKGLWKVPFDERLTYGRDFHNADGSIKRTPFMEFKQKVGHYHDSENDYSFLLLQYQGERLALLLALPDAPDQFPDLELSDQLLGEVRSGLRRKMVEVFLPKWQMCYARELSDDMSLMGLLELFSSSHRGNLSGIRQQDDIFLSLMKHKACIDVNEKGSTAAAATGVAFYARSGFRHQEFVADHPFSYWIVDWMTGAILFSGRVAKF